MSDFEKIDARQAALQAVRKLEPTTGSRMLAYEKVAAAVGVSASWLRKFITVDGTAEPRWSVGCALVEYYHGLCDRVDARVTIQRSEIQNIIGGMNEADPFADPILLPDGFARCLGARH